MESWSELALLKLTFFLEGGGGGGGAHAVCLAILEPKFVHLNSKHPT